MNNYSPYINPQLLEGAIAETPPLISESDLHVAQLTLVLLTSTAKFQSQALHRPHGTIIVEIMHLVRSPLLQGGALKCMLELFQALVKAQLPGLGYRELLELLRSQVLNQPATVQLHKQVSGVTPLECPP